MKVENSTDTKEEADSFIRIKCGEDGMFRYPSPWPKCYDNVICEDPGTPTDFNSTSYTTTTTTTTTPKPWVIYDVRYNTNVNNVGTRRGSKLWNSNALNCCNACRASQGTSINIIKYENGKCSCYSYSGDPDADGKFSSGASLTDLKKKKNAAGNLPPAKLTWPLPSNFTKIFSPFSGMGSPVTSSSLAKPPPPARVKLTTDPLPRRRLDLDYYRNNAPPPFFRDSQQTNLSKHFQSIQ